MVENKYIVSFNFLSLPEYIFFLDIVKDIDKTIDYDLSIYILKLNSMSILSKLTYNMTLNQGELSTSSKNQRNVDIIAKSNIDAEELRKKVQLDNEEIYGINIILTIYSADKEYINSLISRYRAKIFSKGINAEITNFRHLEFYVSNLPLGLKNEFIQNNILITTKALANIFPFFTENILDLKGIEFGVSCQNKKMCMVDIFSSKYENSNMCILGASGSGKSYFTKLCILRNYFQNKIQIVLDIENEYAKLCSNLKGLNIFGDVGFNIFQITPKDAEIENFLDVKIEKIIAFLSQFIGIKIEKKTLKNEIVSLYKDYGITEDINSLYMNTNEMSIDNDNIFIDNFPTLYDFVKKTKYKTLKKSLEDALNLTFKPFLKTNGNNTYSKLIIVNMEPFKSNEKMIYSIVEYISSNICKSVPTIIYIDELFKYCSYEKVLELVCELYKSIRKQNAAIVTITQDITDFFKYKNGYYINAILNNSNFKMLFKTEFEETTLLEKMSGIEKNKISSLKKGEAYLVINNNNVKMSVKASEFERVLLNENDYSNK